LRPPRQVGGQEGGVGRAAPLALERTGRKPRVGRWHSCRCASERAVALPGRRCGQPLSPRACKWAEAHQAAALVQPGVRGGRRIRIVIHQIVWIRIRGSIGFFLQLFFSRYLTDTYPSRIPSVSVSDTYPIRDTWPTSRIRVT